MPGPGPETNAILLPSGDQAGNVLWLPVERVTGAAPEPSVFATQMFGPAPEEGGGAAVQGLPRYKCQLAAVGRPCRWEGPEVAGGLVEWSLAISRVRIRPHKNTGSECEPGHRPVPGAVGIHHPNIEDRHGEFAARRSCSSKRIYCIAAV